MSWHGQLDLRYRHDGKRTVAPDRHEGPLRVLASLHPEAPTVCHHVLVHPPGGIVGGDTLRVDAALAAGAHALITTAGATRFYRSAEPAVQAVQARIEDGARLEWLPLETLVYTGALAETRMCFHARRTRRNDRLGCARARPSCLERILRRHTTRSLYAADRAARCLARAGPHRCRRYAAAEFTLPCAAFRTRHPHPAVARCMSAYTSHRAGSTQNQRASSTAHLILDPATVTSSSRPRASPKRSVQGPGAMFPVAQLRRWYLQFKLGAVTFDINRIEHELAQEFATEGIEPLANHLESLIAERERLIARLAQT